MNKYQCYINITSFFGSITERNEVLPAGTYATNLDMKIEANSDGEANQKIKDIIQQWKNDALSTTRLLSPVPIADENLLKQSSVEKSKTLSQE